MTFNIFYFLYIVPLQILMNVIQPLTLALKRMFSVSMIPEAFIVSVKMDTGSTQTTERVQVRLYMANTVTNCLIFTFLSKYTFFIFLYLLPFILVSQCRVTLNDPDNGVVLCRHGHDIGSRCTIICDPGYKASGDVFTCLPSGLWSGQPTPCQPLQCGEPGSIVPSNGFVKFPCSSDFKSSCEIGCFEGFNLTGSREISCQLNNINRVEWESDGSTCEGESFTHTYIQSC